MFQRSGLAAATSVVAIGALLLTGCASSKKAASNPAGGASNSAGGAGTTASSTTTQSSAAAALVPAALKSKGTLTIALDATYPPDESIATDGHTVIGMDADLGKALAAALGLKASLVNAKFDSIIPRLVDGTYNVGLSSFTDTKDREKTVDFVTYFSSGTSFFIKASGGPAVTTLDALCGHHVSVEKSTTQQDDATAQDGKCKSAGKPGVDVQVYPDQNGANTALSSGRADVSMADSPVAAYQVKQSNGQFKLSGDAYGAAPYGIASPKG
ncbi:MAG: transporter substrate-binding domain-containing protein, partial [Actinomycetota bacterium]|nr:transporter substrate-binding domain-containing protein [Actinomycetota bacterium]